MITGSHIPFDRNGIKYYRADGELLKDDEAPIISSQAPFPSELFLDRTLIDAEHKIAVTPVAQEAWKQRYLLSFDGLLKDWRVGHYQHSAAGRDELSGLLQALGAEVVPLGRSETFVPIDTEAVAENDRIQASEWAKEHQLDALISTDGDGDRPLLATEDGRYFRGDTLGILAARALGANCVVTPVSSTTALEKSTFFHAVNRTKIGSPHVIAAMVELAADPENKTIGFEANGGFLTSSFLQSPWNGATIAPLATRDAVLPVLATIALAQTNRMPLSGLHQLLPKRATASDRLENTPRDQSQAFIERLETEPALSATLLQQPHDIADRDRTDGLRMTFANGDIVHMRPSGNAPELRIYVETENEEDAAQLLAHAMDKVASLLG